MLLNFTVSNWMSYKAEASLNMTSSRERQHFETLAGVPGFRSMKALPVVAVYGGNASGKTGLFKGIAALKSMVVIDPGIGGLLPIESFKLDLTSPQEPTVFDISFLANEVVYRYFVEATPEGVAVESLGRLSDKGETVLFERDESEEPGNRYSFNDSFFNTSEHISYVAMSTRGNQTFLGNAVSQNVTELNEAFGWFANTLELVGVGSNAWSFATAIKSHDGFLEYAGDALARFDTGISGLVGERVDVDVLPKDADLHRSIAELSGDDVITLVMESAGDYGFEMFTVRAGDDRPIVERMRTLHAGSDGKDHQFGLGMESSGTQRLMGLLPMLFDLQQPGGSVGSKVYVVDELDRCLHTMLTFRLIEDYLATCGRMTRKQLLFTTHDLLLMDQSLMRRDEMYIAQRDDVGRSELIGLAEFDGIRFDKDLIRSYLDGRFGGIPMFGGSD